ncbi:MAG: CPBP family intramembrane metalloprotease [FCB group bacterium]|nr:CPBP family intramembrane metalloprotease [FCB group bacterium]
MEQNQYERQEIFNPTIDDNDPFIRFKKKSGNVNFKTSRLTYISLIFIIIIYPLLGSGFTQDPSSFLKNLNSGTRMILFLSTMILQWAVFLLLYIATYRENTLLKGVGFKKIRAVDFAWAFAFLLASNALLSGLAWLLAKVGLPMPGDIALLIPQDTSGKIVWVMVALTAGICEETTFRGYLLTRLRLVGKFKSWVIPTLVSSLVFGACHAYQGFPGFIVISVYGGLFAFLYIRTGSIWPGIIAHFFQDFSALFFPH